MAVKKVPNLAARPVAVPFPVSREVGLGDLVAKATSAIGIRPCQKCKKRRERLNRYRLKPLHKR